MGNLTSFPLLAIPMVVYNIIAFGGQAFGTAGDVPGRMREVILEIPMASGVRWGLTPGDLLLVLALILLFLELLKSTSTGRQAIMNHSLSMIVFIICLVEFLLFAPFATSVFFMITVMALLDVLAGFIVTIVTARRDIAVGEDFVG
ncbi:MAG: hypothetical protein MI723_00365 [Caulobacterales bacterium]|nr:hypothetical protein [Caulobacterales bacterium]